MSGAKNINTTEILRAMAAENGYIELLRGMINEYITVFRGDHLPLFEVLLPHAILDDLRTASFVYQDGTESERGVTTFRLTEDGKRAGLKAGTK
jgi:hypothetical protein